MKTGLGKGAFVASIVIGIVGGLAGCKTQPECTSLGTCGGDFITSKSTDFYRGDGLRDEEWVVVGQKDGVVQQDTFCQDQLQVPPTPLTLLRQPPVQATDRPPDKVTADWCSNIVFKNTGEVNRFIVWAPPIPLKVGLLTISEDSTTDQRSGNYKMEITYLQTRHLEFTETCLTSQGVRLSCPELGRRLGEFLASEANIYSARCFDPGGTTGGCLCDYDVSFIGGPTGRWFSAAGSSQITFFDDFYAPPAPADYCLHPGDTGPEQNALDLTGHDTTALFNQKSFRTMHLRQPTCDDGIQSHKLGEAGVDCGGQCPNKCGTCSDGIRNGDEDGIDCGGSCLGVLCENPGDQRYIDTPALKDMRKAACTNGVKEPWEEGIDCGGPCKVTSGADVGLPKLCPKPHTP
ncbi:MAG: uncharacterized protein JWM82_1940 [Myxococcales bacterium]|nr:uncharacterized protein [Myxococcales bacterium]